MSDSDSDCCSLVRLNSNPVAPVEFDFAPENLDFHIKVRMESGKFAKLVYTLKAGTPLPYTPDIPGFS